VARTRRVLALRDRRSRPPAGESRTHPAGPRPDKAAPARCRTVWARHGLRSCRKSLPKGLQPQGSHGRCGLLRAFADEHGAWANIPPKRNRKDPICFSPYLYRACNLVERFFNRIKQCRRVAPRYDKLAANYLAFIKLAAIRIWLRAYESTP